MFISLTKSDPISPGHILISIISIDFNSYSSTFLLVLINPLQCQPKHFWKQWRFWSMLIYNIFIDVRSNHLLRFIFQHWIQTCKNSCSSPSNSAPATVQLFVTNKSEYGYNKQVHIRLIWRKKKTHTRWIKGGLKAFFSWTLILNWFLRNTNTNNSDFQSKSFSFYDSLIIGHSWSIVPFYSIPFGGLQQTFFCRSFPSNSRVVCQKKVSTNKRSLSIYCLACKCMILKLFEV